MLNVASKDVHFILDLHLWEQKLQVHSRLQPDMPDTCTCQTPWAVQFVLPLQKLQCQLLTGTACVMSVCCQEALQVFDFLTYCRDFPELLPGQVCNTARSPIIWDRNM